MNEERKPRVESHTVGRDRRARRILNYLDLCGIFLYNYMEKASLL
jgi:hypothetical protein